MAQILKDTIGLCQALTADEEVAAKKHGLPVFKGVLYKVNEDSNGNPLFNKLEKINENTVVLGGAVLALQKLFGVIPNFIPKTINEIEQVNQDVSFNNEQTYIKCFGVAIGGAGMDLGSVRNPDFKQNHLIDWVPFRISDTPELPEEIAAKYYFRKQIRPNPEAQWGWFLKEFENTPIPRSYWKETPDPTALGTEVTDEVAEVESANLIESFGECIIKIEEDDIRPYFQWAGNLQMARYNSFGLFTGVKKEIEAGYNDYVGLRLFSVVNFNNVALDMPTSATYLYRVYAAV